ncbi:MAG: HAMP domain-containing histidine kinase [Bacteroidetes bacterium]|nr:HAMP domain-containing histidine kinase [Bacteroidota bacterium]MBS1628462.1 HAMP domain-containing histidine kinase [Bacteroidota bacterium]
MKSRNIRILLVLAALACVGILATQVYGLRRTYKFQAQQFDDLVNIALQNAAARLQNGDFDTGYKPEAVTQQKPGYFIVHINAPVARAKLEQVISESLFSKKVVSNFQYRLHALSRSGPVAYGGYYKMAEHSSSSMPSNAFPEIQVNEPALILRFPYQKNHLMGQMMVWIISSFGLLLVLVFLCYLMYVIFKQRQLSEVQKDFIANMTHEFKTPLASIRLGADVLKSPEIVSQPQRLLSYATIISKEAMQLTNQVDRILQMSKAEQEGMPLNRSDFIWQELLRSELPTYARLAAAKDGSVSLQLPNENIAFHGDVVHLKTALVNLVDNAVKYSLKSPVVRIALERSGNRVILSVSDNGIGIDKASQGMIFNRFFRVHTGNVHDVKGFGIGLNYVRIIAHAHNGEINCISQLGKGSTFTLNLPVS